MYTYDEVKKTFVKDFGKPKNGSESEVKPPQDGKTEPMADQKPKK